MERRLLYSKNIINSEIRKNLISQKCGFIALKLHCYTTARINHLKKNSFEKYVRIYAAVSSHLLNHKMFTMLSRFQLSITHIVWRELKKIQRLFLRLKIMYENFISLLFMSLSNSILCIGMLLWPILFYINFKLSIFLFIGYYSWVRYNFQTLTTEGRRKYWFKNLFVFNFLPPYFPLRLVKTAELPSGRPYILAVFPHAIAPYGAVINLITNGNNCAKLFPGHDIRAAGMTALYFVPIIRELLIALGGCTNKKENIRYLLESNPAKTIFLCPGGIKELAVSHPGSKYIIVKENRKGFVKIALQTGSSLVPVFSFGEIYLYNKIHFKSYIPSFIERQFYKYTRCPIILPYGRGIFNKSFGILPQRHPVTTVVGKPIPVPKVENLSAALIDEYHERFHKALSELFEENKGLYDEAGDEATLETI